MAARVLHSVQIPEDCRRIVYEFLPVWIDERCQVCGTAVILRDRRNRTHFYPLVCTEALVVCEECFDDHVM